MNKQYTLLALQSKDWATDINVVELVKVKCESLKQQLKHDYIIPQALEYYVSYFYPREEEIVNVIKSENDSYVDVNLYKNVYIHNKQKFQEIIKADKFTECLYYDITEMKVIGDNKIFRVKLKTWLKPISQTGVSAAHSNIPFANTQLTLLIDLTDNEYYDSN